MYMSDFIFMIEKTQSSGKQSENDNKFGKGTTYAKGAKKWRENTGVHNWRENRKKGFLSKGNKGFSFRHILRVSLPGYMTVLFTS